MGADPVSLGILAITAAGAGISAYGSYKEGQDAAEAARYNANIKRQEATMIEQSGALDASRQREQTSKLIGKQKALYGSSGVELTGSPIDTMIETAGEGELDARIIEYNTKVRSIGAMSEADYNERLAGIYERSGVFKAAGTLLTAAGSMGANYLTPAKSGTTSATDIGSYKGYRYSLGRAYREGY